MTIDLSEPRTHTTHECPRCGGAGGWDQWPGFTCYLCQGAGTRPGARRLTARQKKQAEYLAESHTCGHCHETKMSSGWYIMKGTELWCGGCFDSFRVTP